MRARVPLTLPTDGALCIEIGKQPCSDFHSSLKLHEVRLTFRRSMRVCDAGVSQHAWHMTCCRQSKIFVGRFSIECLWREGAGATDIPTVCWPALLCWSQV